MATAYFSVRKRVEDRLHTLTSSLDCDGPGNEPWRSALIPVKTFLGRIVELTSILSEIPIEAVTGLLT